MNISKLSRSESIALNINKGSIINLKIKWKIDILIYQNFDKDDQSNYLFNFVINEYISNLLCDFFKNIYWYQMIIK